MVWAIIILLLAGADQLIKYFVEARISYGDSITVIPSFFYLINRRNTGAAWSFLADQHWGIYFLASVSAIVTLVLVYIIYRTPYFKLKTVLTILVAGSVGNLIDRIFRGYVTDYLDFHFGSYAFPTFNLADMLIVCSTAVLCILLFADHRIIDHPFGHNKKDDEVSTNETI